MINEEEIRAIWKKKKNYYSSYAKGSQNWVRKKPCHKIGRIYEQTGEKEIQCVDDKQKDTYPY